MKITGFIDKNFGLFLFAGILAGIIFNVNSPFLLSLLKPLLMVMLFLVFLKIEIKQLFHKSLNHGMVFLIAVFNLLVVPAGFFLPSNKLI